MDMFWIIIGAIIGWVIWNRYGSTAKLMPSSCDTNLNDRKHKWVLRFENNDHKGYLVCRVCGKIPGEE